MLSQEDFAPLFQILLQESRRQDSDGTLTEMYYEILEPLSPSYEEVWAAIEFWLNEGEARLPKGKELKSLVRDRRQQQRPYLPAARTFRPPAPDQSRDNRIALLRGIYKDQGDTPFYRRMLTANHGIWGSLISELPPVTHADVMASMGIEVESKDAPIATQKPLEAALGVEEWV